MSSKRTPAKRGQKKKPSTPVPDIGLPTPRSPAGGLEPIPTTGIEKVIENLDANSSPVAWLTVCRIQYIKDERARDLTWWHKRVWVPNGCPVPLGQIRHAAHVENWDDERLKLWDRVAEYVFDQHIDQQAEESLTAHRKYRAIEALMLEMLTPRIVQTDDGEELRPKYQPKSYEGLVRAMVDLKKIQRESSEHVMTLITGGRAQGDVGEDEQDVHAASKRRMFDFGRLREIANELALQDGKASEEDAG